MRYIVLPFVVCFALMGGFLHVATRHAEAQATAEVVAQMDAGLPPRVEDPSMSTPATSVKDPPPVNVASPPDPIEQPATAWEVVMREFKRARWMGIALALLIVATAYRKRMQPGPDEPVVTGWRAMSIAISSGIVAITGPLVEVGTGTGGWTAVMMGVAFAVGLVMDRLNPPKAGVATKV